LESMKKRYAIIFICLALLICLAFPTMAAEKRRVEVKPKSTSQSAEHRIALVIGNANYRIGPLRNPANDARAIAAALRELGFDVDEQINLSYQDMGRAVNRFGKAIRRDSVALFYYAGHGLQVQGSNYLVPVDMEIQDEGEVQFNTVNAGQVLAKMEEAKNPVNIVILDACRDNPYARGWKRTSLSRGLASMDAPVGSFVAYAAAPGKTADDGKGKNGLYTESLVRQIKMPGMKIEDVFKRVRTEVRSKSNGTQVPEERSSLEGDFYFARGSMVVEEPTAQPAVRETATGKLTVKSNVGGAKVYINRADRGVEPVSATLNPGEYSITLKKEGYSDAFDTVRVEAGSAKTINTVMEKPALPPAKETLTSPAPTLGVRPPISSPKEISRDGRFIAYNNGTVSDTRINLMWAAKDNGNSINWANAKNYCDNYRGGGYTDWRMPTQEELSGLYDTTKTYKSDCGDVHLTEAIRLSCTWAWASETSRSVSALFNFFDGKQNWDHQSLDGGRRVLPVRSTNNEALKRERQEQEQQNDELKRQKELEAEREQLATERRKVESEKQEIGTRPAVTGIKEIRRDGRFIAYDDGTVLDTKTNLMWAAKDNGSNINWANAKTYSENYRGGGYSDWRMPTSDELAGLYDKSIGYTPVCAASGDKDKVQLTNLITLSCWAGWASETRGSDAADFVFDGGGRGWHHRSYVNGGRALPVRFGK